jgi:predicted amidophosphoribosyltransferase
MGLPLREVWAGLTDLLLPAECAGCRARRVPLRHGACGPCVAELEGLRPHVVRPTPAPAGLPGCVALGAYDGALREALLSYKERGRHGLARPLGTLLADVVAAAAGGTPRGVLLIPVPATAKAARARHGDHLWRLSRHTAGCLRRAGWPVALARPLRALPRADSATLDSAGRAAAAAASFRLRATRVVGLRRVAAGRLVIVLDDIVTTGATLAAASDLLRQVGVPMDRAALLAATRRRDAR